MLVLEQLLVSGQKDWQNGNDWTENPQTDNASKAEIAPLSYPARRALTLVFWHQIRCEVGRAARIELAERQRV